MKPTNKLAGMSSGLGSGKIFDVARPGRSPASSTSKPVIVGHKPQIQDPMMAHDIDDERRLLGSHGRVTVAPLGGAEPVAQAPEPTPESSPEPAPETPPAPSAEPVEPESQPLPDVPAPPTTPEEPASTPEPEPVPAPPAQLSEQSPVDEPQQYQQPSTSQPTVPPQADPLLSDDNAASEPKTMPTAIVSHHHHPSGAFKNVAVAVLILLVIGAGVFDILLDAGFVVLNIPHTHFF